MRIRSMGFSSRLKAHRHMLTLETLRFINHFLVGGNARRAALESGIPETYAARQGQWLKKHPMVKAAQEAELDDADLRRLDAKIQQIDRLMDDCRKILNLDEAD